ncbi:MAG: DUF3341 domain-containing protein [Melioribacteraceae bacterium]|nr:DUF3341 domain-containing protein [Melioribacteraceae bacterium]
MSERILYSYTGLFDTPDEIIGAASKTAEAGYTKFDVNTPYPVHGMDDAMKLPPSKLGYASLVFGLSGTIAAILLIVITTVVDYPNIIGGKPFFSLPAFIPIMFEITVLSASIATVVTMIIVFFKFPNNAHPMHDTDYMKAVSSSRYGVSIQADDKIFSEDQVKDFLNSIGAKDISPIYYDDEEINFKHNVLDLKFIGGLFLLAIIVSGTTYFALNKLMYMTPFNWMMEQDKAIVQSTSNFFEDGTNMRVPVEATIARNTKPYKFKNDPEGAAKFLVNPVPGNEKNLELGKKKFNIYCSPCHDNYGKGESRLRGQFPNPPSLHSQKLRDWSDGRIYHVIMEGQNVMPSYSSQINETERWAIINYVRALQRSLNAKESDLQ